MNQVFLLGRLGADAQITNTKSGTTVLDFSLATSEKRGDIQEVMWHTVKAFGKTAEASYPLMKKGTEVFIQGKIWARTWTDKNNQNRKTIEIIANSIRACQARSQRPNETVSDQAGTHAEDHEDSWGI